MKTLASIKELVLFNVDEMLCGIDISHVQEINKNLDFTEVYRAPDFVKGVLNLRGQIVSIIDLRVKFKRPAVEMHKAMRVIIVQFNDEKVGLLVDEIKDVIEVENERLEQAGSNIHGVQAAFFAGMYKMNEDLVVILDILEILKAHE
ncbi:MAG: purine-binding chemotaxis protein CheW [SAR324 cluster bacterium]|nr:purine-binding chemotaxis protein CheW [SAR324 cluster bacterium]